MKKFLTVLACLLGLICFSCIKLSDDTPIDSQIITDPEIVAVSFNYTIDDMQPGNPIVLGMPEELLSQLTDEDYKMVHDQYYGGFKEEILTGNLIYKQFKLDLTEKTTGEKYQFIDNYDTNNIFLIKPGTYKVSGKTNLSNYPSYQTNFSRCFLKIDDEITIKKEDTEIYININDYDCFLLIFDNKGIANIDNTHLHDRTGLYQYRPSILNNYLYYFLTSPQENDPRSIDVVDGGEIYFKDYHFENGKYYIIPSFMVEYF